MNRITIPDFREDDEPPQKCQVCRRADATSVTQFGDHSLAACSSCAGELAPFVASALASSAKGRLDRVEAAWEGFLEMGRLYWSAFALDDEIENLPAVRLIDEMAERLSEDRRQVEWEERQATREKV
jgi:hypothetical protein